MPQLKLQKQLKSMCGGKLEIGNSGQNLKYYLKEKLLEGNFLVELLL